VGDLQSELLRLSPDFDLGTLKQHALERNHAEAYCWLLAKRILLLNHQFFKQPGCHTPLSFLNYFCWQKRGVFLLAP
jgi:hypothetical protein